MTHTTEIDAPTWEWVSDVPADLVDAEALATAYPITESTIRAWAARGYLTRYPQGHRKRTLYSLSEFARVFTEKRSRRA